MDKIVAVIQYHDRMFAFSERGQIFEVLYNGFRYPAIEIRKIADIDINYEK